MERCWQRFPPVQVGHRGTDPNLEEAWLETIKTVLGWRRLYEGTVVWCPDLREARRLLDCLLDRRPYELVMIVQDMVPAFGLLEFGVVTATPWRDLA